MRNRVSFIAILTLAAQITVAQTPEVAVGPQYDTTHVYVAPQDFDKFVASLLATLGGATTKQGVFTVTPTPSLTMSQLVLTPAGTVSVFGFKTPVPHPFGVERTGYLVTDLDGSVKAAQADGADVLVSPFNDPIGRNAVIQWPGGVNMQLYWHTTPPSYPALKTIPENRVYVSPERADSFIRSFLEFSHGKVLSDDPHAPGSRDRARVRYGPANSNHIAIRRARRFRHRRAFAVSVRTRNDRLRSRQSRRDAQKSKSGRSDRTGRTIFPRRPGGGNGPVPGRLHRRDSLDQA